MSVQVQVRPATLADLPAILELQRDAFTRVALELGLACESLPPLTETLDDLRALFRAGTRFLVAVSDGTIVGSVRSTCRERSVEVGRLVVSSGHTRQGVATALMDAVEGSHPEADSFILFTSVDATGPLRLYESRGYVRTKVEVSAATTLVWLEKVTT